VSQLLDCSSPVITKEEVSLGNFLSCASQSDNELEGEVFVVNKRQIRIRELLVARGPNTWFHAQLRPATKITADPGTFHNLRKSHLCQNFGKPGSTYNNPGGSDTLVLPRDITEYTSIGLYDYANCVNIGHVIVKPGVAACPRGTSWTMSS